MRQAGSSCSVFETWSWPTAYFHVFRDGSCEYSAVHRPHYLIWRMAVRAGHTLGNFSHRTLAHSLKLSVTGSAANFLFHNYPPTPFYHRVRSTSVQFRSAGRCFAFINLLILADAKPYHAAACSQRLAAAGKVGFGGCQRRTAYRAFSLPKQLAIVAQASPWPRSRAILAASTTTRGRGTLPAKLRRWKMQQYLRLGSVSGRRRRAICGTYDRRMQQYGNSVNRLNAAGAGRCRKS